MKPWNDEIEFEKFLRRMRFGGRGVTVGIGDDAAVIPGTRRQVLFTTDMMIENVHFQRRSCPPEWLAHKLLARSVSDIASMGGEPGCYVVSLAVPKDLPQDFLRRFYKGLKKAEQQMHASLVGGDLSRSPAGGLFCSLALLGKTDGPALLRSGAKRRDAIWVTGSLGKSAAALELLESGHVRVDTARLRFRFPRGLGTPNQRTIRGMVRAHFLPEPRIAVGRWLSKQRIATAAIDISDGLSTDLNRLCASSGVGAVIHRGALPVLDRLDGWIKDPLSCALNGGEDYELIFTAPPRMESRLRHFTGLALHRIGEIVSPGDGVQIEEEGKFRPLYPRGFDHLRNS
jgi:thiamine-monophosphate kinase